MEKSKKTVIIFHVAHDFANVESALPSTPQVRQIYSAVLDHAIRIENTEEEIYFTPGEIQDLMEDAAAKGILKTRQDPMRIFKYYRQQLLGSGLMRLQNIEA